MCRGGGAAGLSHLGGLQLKCLHSLERNSEKQGCGPREEGLHGSCVTSLRVTCLLPITHPSVWRCHLPHVPVPHHGRQPPADPGADGRERAVLARAPAVCEAPTGRRCGQVRPCGEAARLPISPGSSAPSFQEALRCGE